MSEVCNSVFNAKIWLNDAPSEYEKKNKLFELMEESDQDSAKYIASSLLNTDCTFHGEYSPLHQACRENNLETAKLLIEVGFDKNQYFELIDHCSDRRGTPLTEAIDVGADDIIGYLLSFDDISASTTGYCKNDDVPYGESGYRIVPFNELFNTPHLKRIAQLGGSPDDADEEDNLLWGVLKSGNLELFNRLVPYGIDINIENDDGSFTHQVLTNYLQTNDICWLEILNRCVSIGVDLSLCDPDGCSFICRIVESHNEALLNLVGLNALTMESVSEYYEKPMPRLPYELLDDRCNEEDVWRNTIPALLDGYYGWEESKLMRIMNLAISVFEETFGDDVPYEKEIDRVWDELKFAPFAYFMNTTFQSVELFESEFDRFIDSLQTAGKLDEPDKDLNSQIDRIAERLNSMKLKNTNHATSHN